mmetsp:Transcript_7204/g.15720  ORF Transcript_7204/g.15720 Transcript_7204/m.15720 type:complete len:559 (-) Transcript_7204:921-2597(-)
MELRQLKLLLRQNSRGLSRLHPRLPISTEAQLKTDNHLSNGLRFWPSHPHQLPLLRKRNALFLLLMAARLHQALKPLARRARKKIDVLGSQTDGTKLAADLPAATAIPQDTQHWVQVFGEHIVRNFHSNDWKDREQSLTSIQRSLSSSKFLAGKDPSLVYKTTAEMLAKSLRDKVAPLYHASLELVNDLLQSYCTMLPQPTLHSSMDALMPIIIHRCGNLNTRIHESSLQALMGVAAKQNFGCGYVGPFALAALPPRSKDASQVAQMYGRLDLLYSLLSTYKSTKGLAVEDVLVFAKQGLDMPDEKVRQCAIKVVVEVYKLQKMAGAEFEPQKYLGPVKPALMQVLQRRFAEASAELEGGAAAGGAAPAAAGEAAAATGIKVYGKQLPPLAGGRGGPLTPLGSSGGTLAVTGSGLNSPAATPESGSASPPVGRPPRTPGTPPSGPSSRTRTPVRERTRMSSQPSDSPAPASRSGAQSTRSPSPATRSVGSSGEPAENLCVPAHKSMFKRTSKPSSQTSNKDSGASVMSSYNGALDDAEEQLIQYIMGDDRVMGVAGGP